MIRTQIQLAAADYEALRRIAHASRQSMAHCVREAVAAYVARSRPAESFLEIAGKFPPQPDADIKPHDRWWADAIRATSSAP